MCLPELNFCNKTSIFLSQIILKKILWACQQCWNMNAWPHIFMFYTACSVSVKSHWQKYRDIKAKKEAKKKTRSLCKLTCAHHIRLSNTALLNTCRLWLRGFLRGLQTSSASALELQPHSSCAAAAECGEWCKNIVGFFPYHKKKEKSMGAAY